MQDGKGVLVLIPEYYFSEEGEDCFGSSISVHIQEYTYTYVGTPTLPGRAGKPFDCFLSCAFSTYYKAYIKRTAIAIWKYHSISL